MPGSKAFNNNNSPVDWYVASYLLRFVELDRIDVDDPSAHFLSWENTILVKATSAEKAYEKAVSFAKRETNPYKGGSEGVDVQWEFIGITQVLAIHEELEDGSELMWEEHKPRTLENLEATTIKP